MEKIIEHPGFFHARVEHLEMLNHATLGIHLRCPDIRSYHAGQFLPVRGSAKGVRYYSLASAPSIDDTLHLHVRSGGVGSSSQWLHKSLQNGDRIAIGKPCGTSVYQGQIDTPLLMIATGSGLAPYYGIAREAMRLGHRAPVHLYHGVRHSQDLYLVDQLRTMAQIYPQFRYYPCISDGNVPDGCLEGRALDIALQETPLHSGWRIYLTGNPGMVQDGLKALQIRSISLDSILSDQLSDLALHHVALAA